MVLLVEEVFRFLRSRDYKIETSGVAGILIASILKCVFINYTHRDPPAFHGLINLFAAVVVGALATTRVCVYRISLVWLIWLAVFL